MKKQRATHETDYVMKAVKPLIEAMHADKKMIPEFLHFVLKRDPASDPQMIDQRLYTTLKLKRPPAAYMLILMLQFMAARKLGKFAEE